MRKQKRFFKNFAPRWIIFSCDIILISASFLFSFFLVEHFSVDLPEVIALIPAIITNIFLGTICIFCFSIYKGIIRYSEIKDIVRIIKFAFLQFSFWMAVLLLDTNKIVTQPVNITLLLINLFVGIFLLVIFRLLVKEIYFRAQSKPDSDNVKKK